MTYPDIMNLDARLHILNHFIDDNLIALSGCNIEDIVTTLGEVVSLDEAEVVVALDWRILSSIPSERLADKRIVCRISEDVSSAMKFPTFRHARGLVDLWLAECESAREKLEAAEMAAVCVPPAIDDRVFRPLATDEPELAYLRRTLGLIRDDERIVGGLFLQNGGPRDRIADGLDMFAAVAEQLAVRGLRPCYLLERDAYGQIAEHLEGLNVRAVPWDISTCGSERKAEAKNRNLYYNLLDLYFMPGRRGAGLLPVVEALCAGTSVVSSRYAIVRELLDHVLVFDDVADAVDRVEALLSQRQAKVRGAGSSSVLRVYARDATDRSLRRALSVVESRPQRLPQKAAQKGSGPPWRGYIKWGLRKFLRRPAITVWNRFQQPPWGGANQFLHALVKHLRRKGTRVFVNDGGFAVEAALFNAHTFDERRFQEWRNRHPVPCVHRIDGLYTMHHGQNQERDEYVRALNSRFAQVTVAQSFWSYLQFVREKIKLSNPVIITNTVDPDIFNQNGRVGFSRGRKTRLITTSWSDNIRKGGAVYRWLDDNLDWSRFEYTYVGNTSETFRNIHHLPPVESEELAHILREHDIFITASRNDSCSNAVLEAMACGLPVLYVDDGGHPELVSFGGLPFESEQDIPPALDRLVRNYELFQKVIHVPSIDDVADRYLEIFEDLCLTT